MRALTIVVLFVGCTSGPDNGYAVDLTITAGPTVATDVIANIRSFVVDVSGDETASNAYTLDHSFTEERLIYTPRSDSNEVTIAVFARDASDEPVAYGDTPVTLKHSATVTAHVVLGTDIPSVDMGQPGADLLPLPPHAACQPGDTCAGGPCVDGYCCDKPCTGTCEACNVPSSLGTCVPVPAGDKPHHASCAGDQTGVCAGSCDGTNATACSYPASACGGGTCTSGIFSDSVTCNNGSCPSPSPHSCTFGCQGNVCASVKAMGSGSYHTCVALTTGEVKCWGANYQGAVGSSDTSRNFASPITITSSNLKAPTQFAGSMMGMCALNADQTIACWGDNTYGELGIGTVDSQAHPSPSPVFGITNAIAIGGAMDGENYCAILNGGALRCWGNNGYGQLGDGTISANPSPQPVGVCPVGSTTTPCLGATGATAIASGATYTCALFGSALACWGNNQKGQLGNSNTAAQPFPTAVAGISATQMWTGDATTGVISSGSVKMFGRNQGDGVLGTNDSLTDHSFSAVSVCASADCSVKLTGATNISVGLESACAILNGGAVSCWGGMNNNSGQLGDGTNTTSYYAATHALSSGALVVTSGIQFHCAIGDLGYERNVKCWGFNALGQLGNDGGGTNSNVPVQPKW